MSATLTIGTTRSCMKCILTIAGVEIEVSGVVLNIESEHRAHVLLPNGMKIRDGFEITLTREFDPEFRNMILRHELIHARCSPEPN